MKRPDLIALILLGIFILCLQTIAKAQYVTEWEFVRISKDTSFEQTQPRLTFLETPSNERYRVTVKYEKIVPVVITNSFDNIDTQMIYSGTWTNGQTNATGFTNNTIAWSNVRGNSVSFTFTGTRLEWFSEFKSTHGRAAITIDGGPEVVFNLARENTGPQVVREWNWPESGTHTIRIRVYDNKAIVHDGFRTTSQ